MLQLLVCRPAIIAHFGSKFGPVFLACELLQTTVWRSWCLTLIGSRSSMCGCCVESIRTGAIRRSSTMKQLVRICLLNEVLVRLLFYFRFFFLSGAEAKKVFDDAQKLLKRIIDEKLLQPRGVVAFYSASSDGDDILVYEDDDWPRDEPLARLCGLRQQAEKENYDEPYLCLSDFVAPLTSGISDYVGMFAVSAGFGYGPMGQTLRMMLKLIDSVTGATNCAPSSSATMMITTWSWPKHWRIV